MAETLTAAQTLEKYRQLLPADTGDLYYALYEAVTALNINWRFWTELFATSEERVELLNQSAGAVFRSYQDALRIDVFLAICRLTDPAETSGRKNASLAQLVHHVRHELPEGVAAKLESRLAEIRHTARPISVQRNKVLAHHALSQVSTLDTAPLPGVPRSLVDQIVTEVSEFLNEVGDHFKAGNVAYEHAIERPGGPDALLNRLEIARAEREEYFAKKRRAT